MSNASAVKLTALIERKHRQLPRFVVVSSRDVAAWALTGTTVVGGTLNGIDLGRRTLKRWDDERWFIDLPEALCRRATVDTGDRITLLLRVAAERMPDELARCIADDPMARAVWERLTPSRQRVLREHVGEAKQPATRTRRAARALRGCA